MKTDKQNCYFFVDESKPLEEQVVDCLCETCHDKMPDKGWFWEGSRHGYGPFDFVCGVCGYVIHKHEQKAQP
jgi:hypothetical protein